MKLKYNTNEADLIAYSMFHFKQSRTIKRFLLSRYFIASLFLLFFWFFSMSSSLNPISSIVYLTFALQFYFWWDKYFYHATKNNVQKLLSEGSNKGITGAQTMVISPEGIKAENEFQKHETTWTGVNKLAEDKDYFFIYLSAYQAYVVPKRSFCSTEKKVEFRNQIKRYIKKNISEQQQIENKKTEKIYTILKILFGAVLLLASIPVLIAGGFFSFAMGSTLFFEYFNVVQAINFTTFLFVLVFGLVLSWFGFRNAFFSIKKFKKFLLKTKKWNQRSITILIMSFVLIYLFMFLEPLLDRRPHIPCNSDADCKYEQNCEGYGPWYCDVSGHPSCAESVNKCTCSFACI